LHSVLSALVHGVDVHVGGHAHDAAGRVEDRERQHRALRLQAEPALDFGRHALGRWNAGVPELPQLAVARGVDQAVVVLSGEWAQQGMLATQLERLGPHRG
jgi:hypothetical protein